MQLHQLSGHCGSGIRRTSMPKKYKTKSKLAVASGHTSIVLLFVLALCSIANAQVPVTLAPVAKQQFFSMTGAPLAGGFVHTYSAGTTTPLATYTDSTGTVIASNPIVLDSGGFVAIWLQGVSYKFVLCAAGSGGTGLCAGEGAIQWTIDGITPPPFLNGNNSWTGNETHSGIETFNSTIALNAGGSMSGAFSGNPTFSGTVTAGALAVSGIATVTILKTDTIAGTNTVGGTWTVSGAAGGAGATPGESIQVLAGTGAPTGAGGSVALIAGVGGITSGTGGQVTLAAGAGTAGNSTGGGIGLSSGNGQGIGQGGNVNLTMGAGGTAGGAGGSFAMNGGQGNGGGNGGDVLISPGGTGGGGQTGSLYIGRGHMTIINADAPTSCTSTGVGTGGCVFDASSTDSAGVIALTPAGVPGAIGTATITFKKAMGTVRSACVTTLNDGGTAAWNGLATTRIAGQNTAIVNIVWVNSNVAPADTPLVAGSTYQIGYQCFGRN